MCSKRAVCYFSFVFAMCVSLSREFEFCSLSLTRSLDCSISLSLGVCVSFLAVLLLCTSAKIEQLVLAINLHESISFGDIMWICVWLFFDDFYREKQRCKKSERERKQNEKRDSHENGQKTENKKKNVYLKIEKLKTSKKVQTKTNHKTPGLWIENDRLRKWTWFRQREIEKMRYRYTNIYTWTKTKRMCPRTKERLCEMKEKAVDLLGAVNE